MRLLNASGCLDALTALEVARSLDVFVTKTVTPMPREGNEPVRIADLDGGMLNAIGLANPGIERFCGDTLARLAGLEVWVSVGGFAVQDYADIARRTGLTRARVTQIANLTLLAPDIQESLLFGLRDDLLVERQLRPLSAVLDWKQQRERWRILSTPH